MKTEATIIADSISLDGVRITTIQYCAPRYILAEINTHGSLSKSARSSRAVPTKKAIKEVREHPFVPRSFGLNKPGMKSDAPLDHEHDHLARSYWLEGRDSAVAVAEKLADLEVHKQQANRILEPYMWVHGVITATDWANFFALRNHEDADPEFQALAAAMMEAILSSNPKTVDFGEWHLPYITHELEWLDVCDEAGKTEEQVYEDLIRVSAARCARVSYTPFDSDTTDTVKDLELASRLIDSGHWSPFEHVARPMPPLMGIPRFNKFHGWQAARHRFPNETRSHPQFPR